MLQQSIVKPKAYAHCDGMVWPLVERRGGVAAFTYQLSVHWVLLYYQKITPINPSPQEVRLLKTKKCTPGMVEPAFNPSTKEAEAGGSLWGLRPAWSTY